MRARPLSAAVATVQWAALVACVAASVSAAPHRMRIHANTSLRILSIAGNSDGLLWLGTTEGLHEYTGLRFRKVPGYPFRTANFLATTPDGTLWIGSPEGLVRYRSQFEVLLRQQVLGLTRIPNGVLVKLSLRDNLLFRDDGSTERVHLYARREIMTDASATLWFICGMPSHACSADPERFQPGERVLAEGDYIQAARDRDGRVWAAASDRAVALQGRRIVEVLNRSHQKQAILANPLLPGRNGQVWFLGDTIRGLSPRIEFSGSRESPESGVTAAFEDARGHLWTAVLGRGLIEWIPDPGWERWTADDLNGERAQQVFTTHLGEIIAVTNAHLYRLDPSSRRWSRLPGSGHPYSAVLPLPRSGFLASIRGAGLVRLSGQGRILQSWLAPMDTDDYRAIVPDGPVRWWVGHGQGLLRIDEHGGEFRVEKADLPGGVQGYGVHMLPGMPGHRAWAGYSHGLAYKDEEDEWVQIRTDKPLPVVVSAALSENGDLWVVYLDAYRPLMHGGFLARLRKQGDRWVVQDFPAAESATAMSKFVRRDSRGWIWRGTSDGVYVSDGRATSADNWLHLSLNNGLATVMVNQNGFFEDSRGDVWISGDGGITRMSPGEWWFKGSESTPKIRPSRSEANVTVFEIASIDTPAFRPIAVKYRILPHAPEWKLSHDGMIPPVSGKNYIIEAAFTGFESSAVSRYRVEAGGPQSQQWWRWQAGVVAVLIGGLYVLAQRLNGYERIKYRLLKSIYLLRSRVRAGRSSDLLEHGPVSGTVLNDRYEIVAPVARSGFSIVYEARDRSNPGVTVAIKRLNRLSGHAGWIRQRFAQEVAALASIDHPGVVAIHDSWTGPAGELFIAMPFLTGPTLRSALAAGCMQPARAASLARKIGCALHAIHQRGIVHRDLKPENIILARLESGDEQPVLIDFGAAGIRGALDELAATTLLAGSLRYLAPERLAGYYCPATDTYALGVIVLEMLTGRCLADLGVLASDPAFLTALTTALADAVGEAAPAVASRLMPAFETIPQRRPANPASWADLLAEVLATPARA